MVTAAGLNLAVGYYLGRHSCRSPVFSSTVAPGYFLLLRMQDQAFVNPDIWALINPQREQERRSRGDRSRLQSSASAVRAAMHHQNVSLVLNH